jgi:hypothetical protein
MARMKWATIGLTSALVICWGCGDARPPVSSSREEATVHGTVTVRGQAPTKGTITFDPSNINRKDASPRTADISKNGTYEVKTLVGENSVTVRSPEIDKDTKLSANQKTIDVQPGDNTVAIEIQ